ncbi:malto-oligosyltrehalose synthase [Iamia sp. SCSIO 61187]|uniref:malto-oligosyltrehalose synthase n=1 Tax=Iamia sp. SCSIO 61187 TaxID=2722752 RepID=UPI001C630022|nr:malto-oligosyltrehalose synthase [Iamia sp. SCSIO 61187]QYG94894.1 malto-oligosyltrehalose synthase [Iamia sp. SCSIO 61187]
MPERRPLVATYRIQLTPEGMDLHRVRQLVPYLRDLGVSHVYLSPVLTARTGSSHGYDQVDPTTVSASLGGEDALRALAEEIGVILDIVPNHMGTGDENRWWTDERLREQFFDLDPETGRWRRFFDVDELAALRQEDPEVFSVTHETPMRLVREGVVDGLRVDHPDGLADPAGYLRRLAEGTGGTDVWVEKILHVGEALRPWPVSGTVGYEVLNDITALFVDPAGEPALTALWVSLSGDDRPFADHAAEAMAEQAATTFRPEVERLARTVAASGLDLGDDPVATLTRAVATFPVYRSYVVPERDEVDDADRAVAEEADMPVALLDVLTLDERGHDEVVTRFQQTTPAVTAKGVEDTAFYRYLRLLALNEVGGDPGRFGLDVAAFHRANQARARSWPRNLVISSTHDTKRSADVRARLGLLATHADEWATLVAGWRRVTADLVVGGAPDGVEQALIFQTLLGAWPLSAERLEQYLTKALREAKRTTTWVEPDESWEARVQSYARALLDHEGFLATFLPFQARIAAEGAAVALAQVLLKVTVPGVPDIYQGDELEDLSLVDPDNRRPVDWDARRAALAAADPPPKLVLIRAGLALRARRPDAFAGAYRPIDAGPDVCAFTRGADEVLVVVPLRPGADTAPVDVPGEWQDVFVADGIALRERS